MLLYELHFLSLFPFSPYFILFSYRFLLYNICFLSLSRFIFVSFILLFLYLPIEFKFVLSSPFLSSDLSFTFPPGFFACMHPVLPCLLAYFTFFFLTLLCYSLLNPIILCHLHWFLYKVLPTYLCIHPCIHQSSTSSIHYYTLFFFQCILSPCCFIAKKYIHTHRCRVSNSYNSFLHQRIKFLQKSQRCIDYKASCLCNTSNILNEILLAFTSGAMKNVQKKQA